MLTPTIGRLLHLNIGTTEAPIWRSCIVVREWEGGVVNVTLFLDGSNDSQAVNSGLANPGQYVVWVTSVHEGVGHRDWRWPPRVG